jgi:Xaa-Pro dipeptidase
LHIAAVVRETRVIIETLMQPSSEADVALASDRRADIDLKTSRVGVLLREVGCDGLLLMEPENVAWLSSGAMARGQLDPDSAPALYCNGDGRWLIAGNADSQRLFDEEMDGLGFQLKEYPWHWGREQLLADLGHNRRIACDRPRENATAVGDRLRRLRRQLTSYEMACQKVLGGLVAHALEATCRNMSVKDTEREVAGQVGHRLMHRGALPVHIGVAADGRARLYRQFGFTSTTVRRSAVLHAVARKYGLSVSASRTVSFGQPEPEVRQDHNAVCRVSASYLASTWPDAVPREILLAGRRIYLISGYEHEWQLAPQGFVTGRAAVEMALTPKSDELFQSGWAVVWNATAGAAASCDTFHITEQGPQVLTPADGWPLKRIRIQGAEFVRPDILVR